MRPVALHGEAPSSVRSPFPAIVQKGFRPFFLLAALFAVAILPIWLFALSGRFQIHAYLDPIHWHAHEMVFGYAVAVIAGFLLTAVGNWTGRETAVGFPLILLAVLWTLGRVSLTFPGFFPGWFPFVSDLAFLPALVVVLGRPLIAAKNFRNFVLLAIVAGLFVCNLLVHLDVIGVMPGWRRHGALLGLDLIVLIMVIIAGRVVPMFTRNGTGNPDVRSVPLLERLAMGSAATLVLCDAIFPNQRWVSLLAGVAGIATGARMVTWGTRSALRVPLVWILHVGYAWIPIGLLLRALAALTQSIPPSSATHALTVGAIGCLTLGMMARVSLGHTGRSLSVSRMTVVSFALIAGSALFRVVGPWAFARYTSVSYIVAGSMWTLAFLLYLVVYVPVLTSARVDGRSG